MKEPLELACEFISEHMGTCPLDMFDEEIDCENCKDQTTKCWIVYFNNKSKEVTP